MTPCSLHTIVNQAMLDRTVDSTSSNNSNCNSNSSLYSRQEVFKEVNYRNQSLLNRPILFSLFLSKMISNYGNLRMPGDRTTLSTKTKSSTNKFAVFSTS
uniref:Uncharacterized protein n=1 Tax=Cacopsylla melanoneura TaxID=428564 RepID=A0A8D9EPX7_9HEMI